MRHAVTRHTFERMVDILSESSIIAYDSETTGLHPYSGDRLFSMIFATADDEYYFNFQDYPALGAEFILPREWIAKTAPIFRHPGIMCAHNAKFDMHFLAVEGVEVLRTVWCTQAQERVLYNEHLKYSLEACAARIGEKKDDAVIDWLDKNKQYEWESVPGKKKRNKRYFFARVPYDIIVPYGFQDARVCYTLGQHQQREFEKLDAGGAAPSLAPVVRTEQAITKVFFKMERAGVRIDRAYCQEAWDYERERAATAATEFEKLTGHEFVDSAAGLGAPLLAAGVRPGVTAKGGDSYADDVLSPHASNPVVAQILAHRDASKRAGTYFANFLRLADQRDRIHATLNQGGAATGRTSAQDPNLQNVPERDDSPYPVKRAFLTDAGGFLVSIDYKQQEYRLMLDYAGEMALIEKVKNGADVHQATADTIFEMTGIRITRSDAKNINFALLYGAGINKLAQMLGCTVDQAKTMKATYFQALKNVQRLIRTIINTAERRGYIFNWTGRRCWVSDPRFSYKMPNYLIQGGGADIMKMGLVAVDEFLRISRLKTELRLQIHDEVLLWVPHDEAYVIPQIVGRMKAAYPHKHLPMECSVAWSDTTWFDLKEGVPSV